MQERNKDLIIDGFGYNVTLISEGGIKYLGEKIVRNTASLALTHIPENADSWNIPSVIFDEETGTDYIVTHLDLGGGAFQPKLDYSNIKLITHDNKYEPKEMGHKYDDTGYVKNFYILDGVLVVHRESNTFYGSHDYNIYVVFFGDNYNRGEVDLTPVVALSKKRYDIGDMYLVFCGLIPPKIELIKCLGVKIVSCMYMELGDEERDVLVQIFRKKIVFNLKYIANNRITNHTAYNNRYELFKGRYLEYTVNGQLYFDVERKKELITYIKACKSKTALDEIKELVDEGYIYEDELVEIANTDNPKEDGYISKFTKYLICKLIKDSSKRKSIYNKVVFSYLYKSNIIELVQFEDDNDGILLREMDKVGYHNLAENISFFIVGIIVGDKDGVVCIPEEYYLSPLEYMLILDEVSDMKELHLSKNIMVADIGDAFTRDFKRIVCDVENEFLMTDEEEKSLYTREGGLVHIGARKYDENIQLLASTNNIMFKAFSGCGKAVIHFEDGDENKRVEYNDDAFLGSYYEDKTGVRIGEIYYINEQDKELVLSSDNSDLIGVRDVVANRLYNRIIIERNALKTNDRISLFSRSAEVVVDSEDDYYQAIDGNVYSKDLRIMYFYNANHDKDITSFKVPEGVEEICALFTTELRELIIPESVNCIGSDLIENDFDYYDYSGEDRVIVKRVKNGECIRERVLVPIYNCDRQKIYDTVINDRLENVDDIKEYIGKCSVWIKEVLCNEFFSDVDSINVDIYAKEFLDKLYEQLIFYRTSIPDVDVEKTLRDMHKGVKAALNGAIYRIVEFEDEYFEEYIEEGKGLLRLEDIVTALAMSKTITCEDIIEILEKLDENKDAALVAELLDIVKKKRELDGASEDDFSDI